MLIRRVSWAEQPQPQSIAAIDWDNPITRGLVVVQTGGDTSGWTNNNGTVLVPTRVGLARNFTPASTQYLSRSLEVTYPLTMFALARFSTAGVARSLVSVGASSANRHLLYIGSDNQLLLFSGDSSGQWASVTTYTDTTAINMYVGVVRSSANRQGYVNGISPAAANTNTNTVTASNTCAVGAYWNSGAPAAGFYWPGDIAIAGVFNRALSDSEIYSLSMNPWQLFAPRQIWVPQNAAAAVAGNAPRYMHRTQHGMS